MLLHLKLRNFRNTYRACNAIMWSRNDSLLLAGQAGHRCVRDMVRNDALDYRLRDISASVIRANLLRLVNCELAQKIVRDKTKRFCVYHVTDGRRNEKNSLSLS